MNDITISKEVTFFESLYVPSHKPPLLKLIKSDIIPEINNYHLVPTPKGHSFEGDILTGLSLMVLISLNQEVTYISNTSLQSTHAIHYTFLKSIILDIPEYPDQETMLRMLQKGHFTLIPSILSTRTHIQSPYYFDQNTLLSVCFKPY